MAARELGFASFAGNVAALEGIGRIKEICCVAIRCNSLRTFDADVIALLTAAAHGQTTAAQAIPREAGFLAREMLKK